MRISHPVTLASAAIAVLLIGIFVGLGFQIPLAKSATPPGKPDKSSPHAGPTPSAMKMDPTIERGRALYAQYCATCHGAQGKGDGISGQNLPIKPQDLTAGPVLNPLPHHYLFKIIADGGQTVGLSPLMPGFKPTLNEVQINEIIVFVRTLAQPAFDASRVLPIPPTRSGPVQPIFFSHVVHAGSFQIACQYCHANARRGPAAGVPSVERCMGCHKIIAAQGNPEVQKLHGYWERQEPIPWVRIFKLPEFVQFPHKPHVQAGLQCQTCHGRIEAMEQVAAKTGQNIVNDLMNLAGIPAKPPLLTMGWCVECHRTANSKGVGAVQNVASLPVPSVPIAPGADTHKTNAPLECFTCHH